MAFGKKKRSEPEDRGESRAAEGYYKLHTKAVDDLVDAGEGNAPEFSEEELNQYRAQPKIRLSEWVKAALIKAWFAGSVCFFILWGLGNYITGLPDMLVILGIALGIVTDLLVNNVFRFYAKTGGANDRWMMFPQKRYATFFLNILYAFALLFCVYMLYSLLNYAIIAAAGVSDTVPLGVEPVLFGVFYMGFDMLFIRMKYLFRAIVEDAKQRGKE